MTIRIGTAGWSVPAHEAPRFPGEGTHLQRYAAVMNAVEINSSFYRPHRRATYERWAASVPDGFRFAVKLPRAATHAARLIGAEPVIERFLGEATGLGDRLGPLLVQLPPSLAFDADVADAFFAMLRSRHDGPVACEPRHATWFDPGAEARLVAHRIARVAADPPAGAAAATRPGGWPGLVYYRLHGAPRIYYSDYPPDRLAAVAAQLRAAAVEAWAILDNTAAFEALGDALELRAFAA